jgi:hypothetical protein
VLWALLDDGVVRIEFPTALSVFGPLLGSSLNYTKPVRHNGRLWMLSDSRVMRGVYSADGRLERFEDEVIDRLFALNAKRAEEERQRAEREAATKEKPAKSRGGRKKKGSEGDGQGDLGIG